MLCPQTMAVCRRQRRRNKKAPATCYGSRGTLGLLGKETCSLWLKVKPLRDVASATDNETGTSRESSPNAENLFN
jgi:hypothetical protein